MSLKIDVPDITYTAGSKVTGTVITTTNVDIEKIWIKFIGRGHSTLQFFNPNLPDYDFPPKLHNENVLFVDEKILFEGPDIVHGPRSWTFNFEFPYIGLPSTLHSRGSTKCYHIKCSVTYKLVVYLLCPPNVGRRHFDYVAGANEVIERELLFSTPRPLGHPDPLIVLESQDIARHFKVGEWCHSISNGHLPKESFKLSMSLPSVVIIGQVVSLILYLKGNMGIEQKSGSSTPPIILLQSIAVSVHQTTVTSVGDQTEGWENYIDLASADYKEKPIPMKDGMNIGKILTLKIPLDVTPTFNIKDMGIDYTVTVENSVQWAGKTSTAHFKGERLLVLASHYVPGSTAPFPITDK